MADKWDIDNWVEGRARSIVKSFYPTIVARDTDLPLQFVFERLLQMSKDDKLFLKWEVRCPDCHETIEVLDDFPIVNDGDTVFCEREQKTIELSLDNIYPIFEIHPEYRKYVRSKNSPKKKVIKKDEKRKRQPATYPAALNEILTKNGYKLLQELSPSFKQYSEHSSSVIINLFENGSNPVMAKYDFSNAKIDNNDGTLAIGEHQSINNVVTKGLQEASQNLIEEIMKSNIPDDKKEEVKGAIISAEKEATSDKPNKMILSSILETINKTINIATATPRLISAFEKWKGFFESFPG